MILVKKAIINLTVPLSLLLLSCAAFSQTITPSDKKKLREKEDSLQQISQYMIGDTIAAGRLLAYKDFVPVFLRALKIRNSFYYPFDSLYGISRLYAPDSSFRIFTWYVDIDDQPGFHRGFIQMNTKDGLLKGFVLFDNSQWEANPNTKICKDSTWIGAVYYNIIKTQSEGKNYYTLFGFDHNSFQTSKKWIDVLTFNEKNEPIFGGPYFSFVDDSLKKSTQSRFSIEYKKEARTMVNYVPDMNLILVDHLISETDQPDLPWTFVPDGDYEGFKWQNGKWVHINKVFTYKLKDGQAPVEDPILDPNGNRDEKKLKEKTDKNKKKDGD